MDADPPPVAEPALEEEPSEELDPPVDSEPCPTDALLDVLPSLLSDFFSFESFESFDPSFALSEDLESLDATLPETVVEPETDASFGSDALPCHSLSDPINGQIPWLEVG